MAVTHASEKARWESDGWCLLDALLPDDVVRAAQAELPALFPTAEEFAADRDPERNRPFRTDSHTVMPGFPFEAGALNDLVLHDQPDRPGRGVPRPERPSALPGHAERQVLLGAESDEQLLHVDYGNHTLVVPRTEVGYQHLELFIYLSDVTAETAATRMVSRRLTRGHPDRADVPQRDRLRPSLRGRGAGRRPGRVRCWPTDPTCTTAVSA